MRIRDFEKRFQKKDTLVVYGPFASLTQLREAMKIIRRMFPYRDTAMLDKASHALTLRSIVSRRVVGRYRKEEYKRHIDNIRKLFDGKKTELKRIWKSK
jgi:excinuclease UvrABC nuclease subunit